MIRLSWAQASHDCRVYPSTSRCHRCGGKTVRIDPPWETWRLLCLSESTLTITQEAFEAGISALPTDAVGMLTQMPVRVTNLVRRASPREEDERHD
jgi:hypothetical protein